MARSYDGIVGWLMIMLIINVSMMFTSMLTDNEFRTGVLDDFGATFDEEYQATLVNGADQGHWTGFNTVAPINSNLDGVTQSDSISIDGRLKDITQDNADKGFLDFLDSVISFIPFLEEIVSFIGLITMLVIGTFIYMANFSSGNLTWYFIILLPFYVQTIRVILKFIFPTRID